jgi:hypothetical protein
MSQSIAELLARLAYHMLPPHLQPVARPFHDAAVALISAAIDELELEHHLRLLILRQKAAIARASRS